MPLREYQTELISRTRESWKSGHKRPCIVLGCGGGKSVIVAELARRTTWAGNRVLFIVHRKELCDQIRRTFDWWGVKMELCTIGMVQTVTRRVDKMSAPSLIITDENHHCLANSYRRIYDAFPAAYAVGVTATPVRLDGSGLGDVNDDLIVGPPTRWLIDNGYLADYRYYSVKLIDADALREATLAHPDAQVVSALDGSGLRGLLYRIAQEASRGSVSMSVLVPYEKGLLMKMVHERCQVMHERYVQEGLLATVRADARMASTLEPYVVDDEPADA